MPVLWLRLAVVHVAAAWALVACPLTWPLFWLFAASYAVRMWGAEACYHRYFAHRAFKAGRAMQLVIAVIGCLSSQRGPLWWAATHHVHHKHADTPEDPHSPVAHSFWTAQSGWFMDKRHLDTNLDLVPHYAKFPELRWINKHYSGLYFGTALLPFLAGHYGLLGPDVSGFSAMCWGTFIPSILVLQIFGLANSFGHMRHGYGGSRRYETGDGSVNRPLLALFTFGTGWHNNHHRFAAAARAGFAWYEVDISYYVLRVLSALRLIRELREVPPKILAEGGLRAG